MNWRRLLSAHHVSSVEMMSVLWPIGGAAAAAVVMYLVWDAVPYRNLALWTIALATIFGAIRLLWLRHRNGGPHHV